MTNPLMDDLHKIFLVQERNTRMWVEQWQRYKDAAGVRNAAMAIGKLCGIHNVMCSLRFIEHDTEIPAGVSEVLSKYEDIWENLHIGRDEPSPDKVL